MAAHPGQPILLIMDHYRVNDCEVWACALEDCPEVEGDRHSGWSRLMDGADGQRRSRASISLGKGDNRLALFGRTQSHANDSRPWFETLVGQAVRFITREITGPQGALTHPSGPTKAVKLPDVPPAAWAQMIEQVTAPGPANARRTCASQGPHPQR